MGKSVNIAKEEEKKDSSHPQEQEIDLYIGIFFDGTNNNKYQTMLGKKFRRKEIIENVKKRKPFDDIPDINTLLTMSRSYVENKYNGFFTKSELDFIYFGYEERGNNKDKNVYYRGIEEKSRKTLSGDSHVELTSSSDNKIKKSELIIELTSSPDDETEKSALVNVATNMGVNDIPDNLVDNYKGASAQDTTYTNVAIMESLYKCGKENNEIHSSIYVEGSGTDMQVIADTSLSHKGGSLVIGLGKGTGSAGVEAKTRKAARMVNELLNQLKSLKSITNINVHFDICGFSRGSTSARMFCYVINANPKNPQKSYNEGITNRDNKNELFKRFTGSDVEFLRIENKIKQKEVRNLLIADTVSSIGVLYEGWIGSLFTRGVINIFNAVESIDTARCEPDPYNRSEHWYFDLNTDKGTSDISNFGLSTYHYENIDDYGLWATKLAKNTVHVCALDEFRKNFALVDIQSSLIEDNVDGMEIFIPGCHTDIGGGAAIEREPAYIVNKMPWRRFLATNPMKRPNSDKRGLLDISVHSLQAMGWLPMNDAVDEEYKDSTGRVTDDYLSKHDETIFTDNKYDANPFSIRFSNTASFSRFATNSVFEYSLKRMKRTANLLRPTNNAMKSDLRNDNIIMYRHVTPGYSNIGLKILVEKAEGKLFDEIPMAYNVPKELERFAEKVCSESKKNERHVFLPSEGEYKKLRNSYLHFSFNEQLPLSKESIANNLLVNGPEFAKLDNETYVASRIVYKGEFNKNKKERIHFFDYEGSNIIITIVNQVIDKSIAIQPSQEQQPLIRYVMNKDDRLIDEKELPQDYDESKDTNIISCHNKGQDDGWTSI